MNPQYGLFQSSDAPLSITWLVFSLLVGLALSLLLRWHFMKFGSTLSNRRQFASVFPFIVLTTILIISVVKSSLALSLGLVGALSIVRFRTPIKEPEELAYLFIAIAMGLGLGANQTAPTAVATLVILTAGALLRWRRKSFDKGNLFVTVTGPAGGGESPDGLLERLNGVITQFTRESDLRRFDSRPDGFEATYMVDVESTKALSSLASELEKSFSGAGVTFLDQSQLSTF